VGSGFSVATEKSKVKDFVTIAHNAVEVMQKVLEKYPGMKDSQFFFNGESFCGLSLPVVAVALQEKLGLKYKGMVLETCVVAPEQVNTVDQQFKMLDKYQLWNGKCHECYCKACMSYGSCLKKTGCINQSDMEGVWFCPWIWCCSLWIGKKKMYSDFTKTTEDTYYLKKDFSNLCNKNVNFDEIGCPKEYM